MQTLNGHEPMIVTLGSLEVKTAVKTAAKILSSGQVIATPTDTIYGLAALANNSEAVRKIYEIKGRQFSKPVAICVAEIQDIYHWAQVTVPKDLLQALLPGPVTLCFKRLENLNPELNPNTNLVGIRIPDHSFIREVCKETNKSSALALTSANVSNTKSSLAIEEFTELYEHLGAIFDGGTLGLTAQARLGSTVVDLSKPGFYKIIRPGSAELQTITKLETFHLKKHI